PVAGLADRRSSAAGRNRRGGRGSASPARDAHRSDGEPQRPREAHSHRTAPDRQPADARRAEPALRRQPRAYPADRGARFGEAAEGDAAHSRRKAAPGGLIGRVISSWKRGGRPPLFHWGGLPLL